MVFGAVLCGIDSSVSDTQKSDNIDDETVENQEEIIHEFLIDKEFDNTPFDIAE